MTIANADVDSIMTYANVTIDYNSYSLITIANIGTNYDNYSLVASTNASINYDNYSLAVIAVVPKVFFN